MSEVPREQRESNVPFYTMCPKMNTLAIEHMDFGKLIYLLGKEFNDQWFSKSRLRMIAEKHKLLHGWSAQNTWDKAILEGEQYGLWFKNPDKEYWTWGPKGWHFARRAMAMTEMDPQDRSRYYTQYREELEREQLRQK